MRSPITLVKDAFNLFFSDFKRYFLIMLIPALLSVVAVFLTETTSADSASASALLGSIVSLLSIIVFLIATIGLTFAVSDRTLQPMDSYKMGAKRIWGYLGLSLLMGLIVFVGFLLFIIPGVYLAVALSFAVFFLLLEQKPIVESLKASHALVKGRWWAVFGRMALLWLVIIAFFIAFGALTYVIDLLVSSAVGLMLSDFLSSLTTPLWILFAYELFKDLKQTQTASAEPVVATPAASETQMPPTTM